MNATKNTDYYNAFADTYDKGRDRGYHKLIDDQASAIVERVGTGGHVLEVACGTGLVMERVARFADRVEGVDISPGMLDHARGRGLDVQEGSATDLPFADHSFDTVYSFKALAHIVDVDRALSEMVRVTKVGGHVVFDIYNRNSLRFAIKRLFGPRGTSMDFDEAAIVTRFDTPQEGVRRASGLGRVVHVDGIRVVTPHPIALRLPVVGAATSWLEWKLMQSPLRRLAGFVVFTVKTV